MQADHLRGGALGFQGLAAAFLLYLVGQVRLGLGTVLGGAVLGPAQLQLLVLLGDVGIGLMTIFNMLALYPLSGEALTALREYEAKKKLK